MRCPLCGQPAVVTISERTDHDGKGHVVAFECTEARHVLTESQTLALWAADRANSQ